MKRQHHNGIEPWHTRAKNAERFFNGNYVKVLDIIHAGAERTAGSAKRVNRYRFLFVLNYAKTQAEKRRSSLVFNAVTLAVEGLRSKADFFRVRREFEVQASSFVNNTKAKEPNFIKAFEKVDLQKARWSHWYPGLTEGQVEEAMLCDEEMLRSQNV